MQGYGATPQLARAPRELAALALFGVCASVGCLSVVQLFRYIAFGAPLLSSGGARAMAWFSLCAVVTVCTIQRGGLLALAGRARGALPETTATAWWCWFVHFKLSMGATFISLLVAWSLRDELLLWWVAPLRGGPPLAPIHFQSAAELRQTHLLLSFGTMWLFALPFFASDVWRLLLPLTSHSAKVSKLRVPFALVTALVASGLYLALREGLAHALFAFFVAATDMPI